MISWQLGTHIYDQLDGRYIIQFEIAIVQRHIFVVVDTKNK